MYGRGGLASGVATTVAGVAILPNTGNNTALAALAIATIAAGALVTASFVFTRIYTARNQ